MKLKIGAKLILMIAIVAIVITLAISLFSIQTTRTELKNQISAKLSDHAFHSMEKLDRFMFERISDIKVIISKENAILVSDEFDINKKLDYLRRVEKEYKTYASMSIVDVNGIVIGNTRGIGIGNNDRDKPYFKESSKGNIYSDPRPIFSESLGVPVIHFSGPLRDENGNIKGVLVASFPINKINDIVRSEEEGDISIELLDKDGLVLFSNHKREDILRQRLSGLDIFKKVSKSKKEVESLVSMREGKEVLFIGLKEQGYLDYKGNDWILVLGIDTNVALAPVKDLVVKILVSALVISLVAVLLAFFISRSISKPIMKLNDAAIKVGEGKLDTKIEIRSKDEIGELATSFNRMTMDLKTTTTSIDNLNKEITKRKQLEEELKAISLTDELTGLHNRRAFNNLTEYLFKIAKRQKQGLFILYADIDNFKEINDKFGHKDGDNALIDVANILKENYRESDIIARIGGDEFVVFPVGTTKDHVEIIKSHLQKKFDAHNAESNHNYKLSLSIGIAYYDPENPCSVDELLTQADKLMYEEKRCKQKA